MDDTPDNSAQEHTRWELHRNDNETGEGKNKGNIPNLKLSLTPEDTNPVSFSCCNGLICDTLHQRSVEKSGQNDLYSTFTSTKSGKDCQDPSISSQVFPYDKSAAGIPDGYVDHSTKTLQNCHSFESLCNANENSAVAESTAMTTEPLSITKDSRHVASTSTCFKSQSPKLLPFHNSADSNQPIQEKLMKVSTENSANTDNFLHTYQNDGEIFGQNLEPETNNRGHKEGWLQENVENISDDFLSHPGNLSPRWAEIDKSEHVHSHEEAGDVNDRGTGIHEFLDWSVSLSDLTSMHSTSCATGASCLQLQGILSTNEASSIMSSSVLRANQFDNVAQSLVASNSVFWTSRPENGCKRSFDSREYFEINDSRPVTDYLEEPVDSDGGEDFVNQNPSASFSAGFAAHLNGKGCDCGDTCLIGSDSLQGVSGEDFKHGEFVRATTDSLDSSLASSLTFSNSSDHLADIALENSSLGAHSLLHGGEAGKNEMGQSILDTLLPHDGHGESHNDQTGEFMTNSPVEDCDLNQDGQQHGNGNTSGYGIVPGISQRKHSRQKKKHDKRPSRFKKFEKNHRSKKKKVPTATLR